MVRDVQGIAHAGKRTTVTRAEMESLMSRFLNLFC